MRIYLDACCLNRPFDNRDKDRVSLESEAILSILNHSQAKDWFLLNSEVVDIEISKIPDSDKRQKVSILATIAQKKIIVDESMKKRAIELENLGFKPFDALHIVCAEKGKADILLTTDDRLLRKARENAGVLKVRVENPVRWLMEVAKK